MLAADKQFETPSIDTVDQLHLVRDNGREVIFPVLYQRDNVIHIESGRAATGLVRQILVVGLRWGE